MEYILAMTFTTEGGKNTTLSISGVKSDITPTDANSLMDLIISKNIFSVDAGALRPSCRVIGIAGLHPAGVCHL